MIFGGNLSQQLVLTNHQLQGKQSRIARPKGGVTRYDERRKAASSRRERRGCGRREGGREVKKRD